MIVFAQCLLDKGLVIQRHHIVRQHRLVIGTFSLRDRFDDEMKRSTRTASLVMADVYDTRRTTPRQIGEDLLPPLVEATLIHWHDRVFTVTGFERVPVNVVSECSYRQSWILRIPTAEEEHELRCRQNAGVVRV
ncbi:MAG: hypothetical protein EOO64_01600 [Massilia sp.]|nr:MAG: hypothetical protein EOO64_01600 [Massilia sp.]